MEWQSYLDRDSDLGYKYLKIFIHEWFSLIEKLILIGFMQYVYLKTHNPIINLIWFVSQILIFFYLLTNLGAMPYSYFSATFKSEHKVLSKMFGIVGNLVLFIGVFISYGVVFYVAQQLASLH